LVERLLGDVVMKLSDLSHPSSENPRVRARWCSALLAELEALSAADQERIEDCLDPGLREAIAEAGELGWIPAETFVGFADVVLDVIGDDQFFTLYEAALLANAQSPLLQSTSTSAIRLFGPRGVVLGFVPAWELFAWDCARIRVGDAEAPGRSEAIVVEFSALPPVLASSWAFNAICRATLQASLASAGLVGSVEERQSFEPATMRFWLYARADAQLAVG
jgi:hypothetical protein